MGNSELAKKLLNKLSNKRNLNESGLNYDEGHNERLPSSLSSALRDRTHSLGAHPIFPESDESHFEEKIISKRFSEVMRNYKRSFDTDTIDETEAMMGMSSLITSSMGLEKSHRKKLEEIAVNMIREEYDMDEDAVEIIVELVDEISLENTVKNPTPEKVEFEFDSHEDIAKANGEVYKRRFINAMIQGAAKKTNSMFHLVADELSELNPQLPAKYSKMMSAADYMYYIVDKMEN